MGFYDMRSGLLVLETQHSESAQVVRQVDEHRLLVAGPTAVSFPSHLCL